MKGFKDFLMQGNLIELATAVIMAGAFGKVVEAFTKIIMDLIAKVAGGEPNFDAVAVGGVNVGVFITALISFIMIAAVVYFMVIKPYQALKDAVDARLKADTDAEAPAPTTDELLAEIRDLLKTRA